jgi:hypothetical protein
MVSLIVHGLIGVLVVVWIVRANPLVFARPAGGAACSALEVLSLLPPLFTVVDGHRRRIRRPWLFFVASLFTRCAFAYACYFAVIERQHRHTRGSALDSITA